MLQLVKPAFAQGIDIGKTFVPAKWFNTTASLVNILLPNVFTIAGVVALIFVVFAGFNYIVHAGSGDAKQTEANQRAFTAAVMGLIIIVGAYFALQIIEVLLGYKLLSPSLKV